MQAARSICKDLTNVGPGNINFNGSANSSTILTLANNLNVTGNVAAASSNIGQLTFLGNDTFTGTIGSGNAIYALNVQGAGSTVNLQGSTNVGAGNINFNGSANAATTLTILDGLSVTGNVAAASSGIGTLSFLGNNTFGGTIGSGNALFAITQDGAGKTVNYSSSTVNATNYNFINKANASTMGVFAAGTVLNNVDNQTGTAGYGTLQFQGSGQIKGNIGLSNALNLLTVNSGGAVSRSMELDGTTINVNTININDDGSGNAANGTTLLINNTTGALTLNGSITAKTTNEDTVNLAGKALRPLTEH